MGYEVHIIRKINYENDDEESSITFAEWLEYVASDTELKLTNGYQMNIPNVDTSWKDDPGFTLWIAHPRDKSIDSLWFSFWKGIISAKYPDVETIKKMLSIAKAVNAKVMGDDNELYDDSYFDNKSDSERSELLDNLHFKSEKKPWWKFW